MSSVFLWCLSLSWAIGSRAGSNNIGFIVCSLPFVFFPASICNLAVNLHLCNGITSLFWCPIINLHLLAMWCVSRLLLSFCAFWWKWITLPITYGFVVKAEPVCFCYLYLPMLLNILVKKDQWVIAKCSYSYKIQHDWPLLFFIIIT